ncbi:NlpC/P60 family protein [Streptomyces botrytidirepellens]|uniref:NlpC/P60 family protein n=1 Tax=Streptomyces botrytidirepellens TaxID=2486417 RepID=A0A3M8T1Y1_9ACTN|nr:NlpC/P60 family protein [Streptomyces botrytidirepellens]
MRGGRRVGRDGRGRRTGAATAAALVCALGTSALPAGPAYAAPGEPEPASNGARGAGSGGGRLEKVRSDVDRFYRQAESATDAYNLAREKQARQEKSILKIARAVVKAQKEMTGLRERAGALARAQYRGGGMPPEARLLLGDDPGGFLDGFTLARKGEKAAHGLMNRLEHTKAALDRYAESASREWERLDRSRAKKAAARAEITEKLARARRLESRLEAKERDRLRQLQEQRDRASQAKWLKTGILREAGGRSSGLGRRAIDFATAQIGKSYVWGAVGPDGYDCSGLTQRAWASAGRSIPRTSQEQWRLLPKVDTAHMRPGDLVIYFKDASHVGMYVGDGAIVHAPRPGRRITLAGAGSMPILGVVRPDAS